MSCKRGQGFSRDPLHRPNPNGPATPKIALAHNQFRRQMQHRSTQPSLVLVNHGASSVYSRHWTIAHRRQDCAFDFALAHSSHSRADCFGALHQLRSLGDPLCKSSTLADLLNATLNPTNAISRSLLHQGRRESEVTASIVGLLDIREAA